MIFSKEQMDCFLKIAEIESLKSGCLRAQVGAVIVNAKGNVLSIGYNAPPPCLPQSKDVGFCNKEKHGFPSGEGYHVCRSIHAEQRAILNIGIHKASGQTLFVFGHSFICNQCQQVILLAGIKEVILKPSKDQPLIHYDPTIWIEEKQEDSFGKTLL